MNAKVSIVIPALNEEKSIPILCEQIKKVMDGLSYEVIFVDDGSSDRTPEITREIIDKDAHIKMIRLRKNFGKACAYSAGFEYASGDIIVTMDADLQDDPSEIRLFLKKIEEGYDLVSGWKYKGKGRADKAIASKIFNKITAILTGINLHDFNCPFKAYKKEVVKELELYGDLFRFIPVLVAEKGYKIGEVKILNPSRKFGKSRYSLNRYARAFLDLITVLFLTKFKRSPLYLFGSIGFVMFISGFVINSYLSYQKIFRGMVLSREPLLLLGILFMVLGAQFISIGLITEMIVNISHERSRIHSFIKEVVVKKED